MSKLAQILAEAISKDTELLKEIQQEIVKTPKTKTKKKVVKPKTKKAKTKKVIAKKPKTTKRSSQPPAPIQTVDALIVSAEELNTIEEEIKILPTQKRQPVRASDCIVTTKDSSLPTKHNVLQRGKQPIFITADETFKPEFIKQNQVDKALRPEIDRRDAARKFSVRCHVCGKDEMVPGALVPMSFGRDGKALYRCNDCK